MNLGKNFLQINWANYKEALFHVQILQQKQIILILVLTSIYTL